MRICTYAGQRQQTNNYPYMTNFNRLIKPLLLLAAAISWQACSSSDHSPEKEEPVAPEPAPQTFSLGIGWNLGNQLDAYDNELASETAWGNKAATRATFQAVKDAGFTSIRIPVTWLGKVGAAPEYKIDADWLDRVAELVNHAESVGLKAIINIHHDGGHWLDVKKAAADPAFNDGVKAQLKAMWTQIAQKFASKGEFLVFESMNEIHDGGWGWGDNRKDGGKQYGVMNEWQQVFVDAVRSTGGNNSTRWLGVPTYCTSIDLAQHFKLPSDPAGRLMIAVHCYEPFDYCLENKYSEWGHTGTAGNKHPSSDEKKLLSELDNAQRIAKTFGVPVYIGEFGCTHRADARAEAFRKYYLEYYCKAAADRGLAVIYWDNGSAGAGRECSGLIDHGTGAWLNNGKEIVDAMVKGHTNTDKAYTLETVYAGAPK